MAPLTATYTGPQTTQTLSVPLASPPQSPSQNAPSTDSRTATLHGLSTALKQLQSDVNVFLTQRKEDDDRAAAAAGGTGAGNGGNGNGKRKVREEEEEENYGEEVAEE